MIQKFLIAAIFILGIMCFYVAWSEFSRPTNKIKNIQSDVQQSVEVEETPEELTP